MRIFFSVGEPSGDQHASRLIDELRDRMPGIEVTGYGGPLMQATGCHLHYRLTDLALMGLSWMKPNLLWRFYSLIRQAGRIFDEERPDAVVLVNFSGFNWRIASQAKARGIPVFFYLPPQLWAWAPWRIRRVRRLIDRVLCALPFEQQWYEQRGANAKYVGHPFFDQVAEHALDEDFLAQWSSADATNVGILPGSRHHEVQNNFPIMVRCISRLAERFPEARFLVACYNETHRRKCLELLDDPSETLPIHFCVGKTPEIIAAAQCCLMVSGSVSLEMLARETPAVVVYYCGRIFGLLARLLVHCKYASLPNLIADREIMPEFFPQGAGDEQVEQITQKLASWLDNRSELERVKQQLRQIHEEIGTTGAIARTADAILDDLQPAAQRAA